MNAAINTELLMTFVATVVVIVAIPGPAVLFIVGRALSIGRPAALAAAAGNTLGTIVQGIIGAFGLGALVTESSTAYTVIKTGGAAYLVVLGATTLHHRKSSTALDDPAHNGNGRHLRQGFVVGLTNPKTIVFLAAALPQFIDRTRGHVVAQMLVLLLAYSVICMAGDAVWSMAGGMIRSWTASSSRRIESLVGVGGLCIIAVGVSLVLSH